MQIPLDLQPAFQYIKSTLYTGQPQMLVTLYYPICINLFGARQRSVAVNLQSSFNLINIATKVFYNTPYAHILQGSVLSQCTPAGFCCFKTTSHNVCTFDKILTYINKNQFVWFQRYCTI